MEFLAKVTKENEEDPGACTLIKGFKIGGCFGMTIAIAVVVYGELLVRTKITRLDDWLVILTCPPSIVLIAVDNARWYVVLFAQSIVILANGMWYAFVFGCIGRLFQRNREAQDC